MQNEEGVVTELYIPRKWYNIIYSLLNSFYLNLADSLAVNMQLGHEQIDHFKGSRLCSA